MYMCMYVYVYLYMESIVADGMTLVHAHLIHYMYMCMYVSVSLYIESIVAHSMALVHVDLIQYMYVYVHVFICVFIHGIDSSRWYDIGTCIFDTIHVHNSIWFSVYNTTSKQIRNRHRRPYICK